MPQAADWTERVGVTHVSDIVVLVGVWLELGGLNLTGSRLLMLSKNSEVCLAGVAGINK